MSYDTLQGKCKVASCVVGETFRFTVLSSRMIRLEYSENGVFEDRPSVFAGCRCFADPAFEVCNQNGKLELHTEYLSLFYNQKLPSLSGLSIKVRSETRGIYSTWHYGDDLLENLGGTARTLDMADGEIPLCNGIQSRLQGYSVIDDSSSPLIESDGTIKPRSDKVIDLYFFGYGLDYQAALNDFFALSGKPPMLPRYAFGNWWSRFHAYTADEYLSLMDRFSNEQIPFSVAVMDMDWHITDIPAKQGKGWTGYTWNHALFPDPKDFLKQLHSRGLKCALNLHPAEGIQPHEEYYSEAAVHMGIDPESKKDIPFDMCSKNFIDTYFNCLLKPREEEGVDFWWIDWQQGDASRMNGVDPLWLLNHFHYLHSAKKGKRPMILSRYAGPGSHRYPVGFSGDTVISWQSLRFQPYFTATAANIGYGWWSHDIGGHCGGIHDEELTARWVQFGTFSPIMRLHSTSNLFSGREPWNYSEEICRVLKFFLRLRHRMIPYLYTMNYLSAEKGIMPLRPMYYLNPNNEEAYQVPNQYYFGDQLIVCPITSPGSPETGLGSVVAWIPSGIYYDVFTAQRYSAEGMRILHRPISAIPVLAKAGSIIPLTGVQEAVSCGTRLPTNLEVNVFCGESGKYTMYEDDETNDNHYAMTDFSVKWSQAEPMRFCIKPDADTNNVRPKKRAYSVRFFGIENSECFVSAGTNISFSQEYNSDKKVLILDLQPIESKESIEICVTSPKLADIDRDERIFSILQKAKISYEQKEKIYHCICRRKSRAEAVPELQSMTLSPDLINALIEQIFS